MTNVTIDALPAAGSLTSADKFPVVQTSGSNSVTKYGTVAQILSLSSSAVATSTTLGVVKIGSGLSIDGTGNLTANFSSLPTASTTTLGGVKIDGTTITISNGVISSTATGSGSSSAATTSSLGVVQIGTGINVSSGLISVLYGTTANTAAQGNDTRITGAAPLASPAFTGTPTTPNVTVGTSNSQIANTAYVMGQGFLTTSALPVGNSTTYGVVKPDGTTLTNSSGAISVTYGTSSNTAAQGNDSRITGAAPLASPTFTGTPAAPTPSTSDNSTTLATTAYVTSKVAASTTGVSQVLGNTGSVTLAQLVSGGVAPLASPTFTGTVTIPAGASISGFLTTTSAASTYAPLASPALTGSPTAPTATTGDNTTKIATTAFVAASVAASTTGVSSVIGNTGAVTLAQLVAGGVAPLASPTFTGSPTVPGYLSTTSASSTYAPKSNPVLTGTVDLTGATTTAATATTTDSSTLVATTAYVQANLANNVTGTTLSGTGTAGVVKADSAGNISIQSAYPFPAFNETGVVTGRIFIYVAPVAVTLTSINVGAPQVSGASNGYTVAVSVNGASVTGLTSVSATGTSGVVSASATSATSVSAGQQISFQVTVNGTIPSAGSLFVQFFGSYA